MNNLLQKLRFIASEITLGSLIAILSVFTAVASYQGSMADSEQSTHNVMGQQRLTNANAEYLTANQLIVYDYQLYDSWYTNENEQKAAYYLENFSQELRNRIDANATDIFDDTYYEAMYANANALFADAQTLFEKAQEWNRRGDALQLVMLITAVGLAFAAWASLLKEESKMRLLFAALSIGMFVYGLVAYLSVPAVSG
ncbi:MAG: hypothetical protein N2117_11060 [Anaerolineales bacterium]|nr:hypothetical protein [Anaerolineales bacterium]MCX7755765.1 hypothetical protein [Anaerolineales bacterium]MDW8279023.1 hypothetical protein [Anaerolineales bacterium]